MNRSMLPSAEHQKCGECWIQMCRTLNKVTAVSRGVPDREAVPL
jgi:hypothetical protein